MTLGKFSYNKNRSRSLITKFLCIVNIKITSISFQLILSIGNLSRGAQDAKQHADKQHQYLYLKFHTLLVFAFVMILN